MAINQNASYIIPRNLLSQKGMPIPQNGANPMGSIKTCCFWLCCLFCMIMAFLFLISLGAKREMEDKHVKSPYQNPREHPDLDHRGTHQPHEIPHRVTVKKPDDIEVASENSTKKYSKPSCISDACMRIVGTMKSLIKEEISPCEDFYDHACGNYDFIEGEEEDHIDGFFEDPTQIVQKVTSFIDEHSDKLVLPSEAALVKVYKKCLNKNHQDVEDLIKTLTETFMWPFHNPKDVRRILWVDRVLGYIMSFNPHALQLFDIVGKGKRLIIRPKFCHGKHEPINVQVLKNVFDFISIDPESETRQWLEKSLRYALEIDTVREYCTERAPPVKSDEKFTVNYGASHIRFLDILTGMTDYDLPLVRKKIADHVDFEDAHEFFEPNSTINMLLEYHPLGMAHYLVIKYIEHIGSNLLLPDNKHCSKIAVAMMPRTALSIYINHFIQPENANEIPQFVDSIRSEFVEMINGNSWFRDPIKSELIEKIKTFNTEIGAPGVIDKEDNLLEKIEVLSNDSFYQVFTRYNLYTSDEAVHYIIEDDEYDLNKVHPTHTKSNFNRKFQTSKLLASMLTDPLFDISYPLAIQYGRAGLNIATEMGYALNWYTKYGTVQSSWKEGWDLVSSSGFKDNAFCAYDQAPLEMGKPFFSQYFVNLINDYIGMRGAWNSFKRANKNNDGKFPGFTHLKDDQMFFYSMVQSKCHEKTRLSDLHRQKFNGILSQIDGFGKAFNCPAGSRMTTPQRNCTDFY